MSDNTKNKREKERFDAAMTVIALIFMGGATIALIKMANECPYL